MSRFIKWLSTDKGKKFSLLSMSTLGFGSLSITFFPETFLIDKYKTILEFYRSTEPLKVNSNLLIKINEIKEDLKLPEEEKANLEPFTVCGFDLLTLGSLKSPYGAKLGIPSTFYYHSLRDIDKEHINVRQKQINWSSEDGKLLSNSLILSDNAKKFAIASKIYPLTTYQFVINTILPFNAIVFTYFLSRSINKKLNLFQRPLIIRVAIYSMVSIFFYGYYSLFKDLSTTQIEAEADEFVSNINSDYLEGGIEFLTKSLERNIALRNLLGREGEAFYTSSGNEVSFLRYKHIPLTNRKSTLEKIKLKNSEVN